jgi:hypothetical protein
MTEQRNQSIPGAPARAESPDTGRRRLLSAGVAALSAATIGTDGWLGAAGRAHARAAATAPKARIASLTFDYRGLSRRGIAVMQDEIAAIAGAMPKSGYAANSQGKACAAAGPMRTPAPASWRRATLSPSPASIGWRTGVSPRCRMRADCRRWMQTPVPKPRSRVRHRLVPQHHR